MSYDPSLNLTKNMDITTEQNLDKSPQQFIADVPSQNQQLNTTQGPPQMSYQDMQQFGFSPEDFNLQMSSSQQNLIPQLEYQNYLPPEINPNIIQYADPFQQYQFQCYQQFAALIPNATYEGSYNNNYEFEGKGKLTWPDGSYYDGMWKKNVRHGIGEYNMKGGMIYKGQWVNDMKHGQGFMKTENGDQVFGTWSFDKKNGMAKLIKNGSNQSINVIYKDDMMIKDPVDTSMDSGEIVYTIFSVIFFLVFVGGLTAGLYLLFIPDTIREYEWQQNIFDSNYGKWKIQNIKDSVRISNKDTNKSLILFIVSGVVWLIYQIMSCCNKSTKYIWNIQTIDKTFENISLVQKSEPRIEFHMECYRYETETHERQREDGTTETYTTTQRIHCHSANQKYGFQKCVDKSPPASTLHYIKVLLLARLNNHLTISRSWQAESRYQQDKHLFIQMNSLGDENIFTESESLEGHKEFTLVYNNQNGKKPTKASFALLLFLDFIVMGWIQRIILVKTVFEIDFQTVKYIEY